MTDLVVLDRLEAFYDAVPRDRATIEHYGGMVLFVPNGVTHPFYGRPEPDGTAPTAADVAAVRARQRELGLPEALEWIHEVTPGLLALVEATGLAVLHAPLMLLDPATLPDLTTKVRILAPDAPNLAIDLALADGVAAVGFGTPGTGVGPAGPTERDAVAAPPEAARLRLEAARMQAGLAARALAETAEHGVAACGQYQRAGAVVEIVGVATLPVARRRGLAAAVTTALARHALDSGASTVFLSAAEEAVARMYARLGFRRIGTACIAGPAH